jgi:transcription elongation factor Elf1
VHKLLKNRRPSLTEPDLQEPFADACLRVTCPHCSSVERDEYEVLEADEVHVLRCGGCGERFYLLLAECPGCTEESAFTWPGVPTPDEIGGARCSHCNARVCADDESLFDMGGPR